MYRQHGKGALYELWAQYLGARESVPGRALLAAFIIQLGLKKRGITLGGHNAEGILTCTKIMYFFGNADA